MSARNVGSADFPVMTCRHLAAVVSPLTLYWNSAPATVSGSAPVLLNSRTSS